jgi:hypothetical protein
LGGERRFGRDTGRVAREIMDDDAIGPGELLALVALAVGHLNRRTPRHDQHGEHNAAAPVVRVDVVRML